MNGVCCRRLLDNIDTIFEEIRELCLERLLLNKRRNVVSNEILLTNTINSFQFLFETMDNVFSGLRIISPVENKINNLQNAITVLESVWRELDLNITPKAHILFVHAVEQVRRFGGIADLVEDFIEKAHQTGKKLDHLVAQMCSQGF